MTTRLALVLALAAGLAGLATVARAASEGGYEVVVSPDVDQTSVSRATLAEIFLKKVTRWDDGSPTRPVDREPGSDLRRRFSADVLGRGVDAVLAYWQQLIFSGRGLPPPELTSDDAIVSYVLAHPGAVGYVRVGTNLRGARVVDVE